MKLTIRVYKTLQERREDFTLGFFGAWMLGGMVSLASQLYGPTDSSVLAFFRGLCWLSAFILGGGLLSLGVSRPLILLGGLAGIPSLYGALLLGAVIGLCLGMFVLPLLLGFLLSLFGLSLYS